MKKTILFIVLLFCLSLSACSNTSNTVSNINISETANSLDSYYSNMSDMNADQLSLVYDFDVNLCDEYVIKCSSESNGNFYAILKVSSDNKTKVKDQMKNLFNVMIEQNNLYTPDAVLLIKNRLETSIGDYLIYLVGEDTNALYDVVKKNVH